MFEVLNSNSSVNRMYSLNVPVQITYEYISGGEPTDYLNAITLSEEGSYLCREDALSHNLAAQHIPAHCHDYYEMMIVLEGSVSQIIEDNDYNYEAGSICLLNRNLRHKEHFHGQARLLFLGFSVDYLKQLFDRASASAFREEAAFLDTTLVRFIRHDMQHAGAKAYLDFIPTIQRKNPNQRLHDLSEQLITTFMQPTFGAAALVDGLLSAILAHTADPKNYHCTTVGLVTGGDYLIFMHIEHLLEESGGRLSRAELSQILNYSGDYINRIVKKYSGLSLHEYNLKFALRRAAQLLIHTNDSATQILHDLGFSNRTYFYKMFQMQYGMTPKEYRSQGKV